MLRDRHLPSEKETERTSDCELSSFFFGLHFHLSASPRDETGILFLSHLDNGNARDVPSSLCQ
jgi:hypothetical protein